MSDTTRYFTLLLLLCGVLFSVPSVMYASVDTFRIRTLVGDDITPPSIPSALTATPVALSQINLSWGTSTDDVELGGYFVFRDDVQIATTTGTNYADVGLVASTTYTYYIIAYDSFFNLSASSTEVSATTFALPPPTATTTSMAQYGTRLRHIEDQLVRLAVYPERESVRINYETHRHVRTVLKWGRTTSYELGSLAERTFSEFHETYIGGLTPGVTYQFRIEGENHRGEYGVLTEGTFMTLPPDDVFPPGNVTGFSALIEGDDIRLSWRNPTDVDFAKVRVLRSDLFYPSDLADGWVVYEGEGTSVFDEGILGRSDPVFYTAFTYDALGNVSSGAVISVHKPLPTIQEGDGDTTPTSTVPITETLNTINLSLDDILITQEGERIAHHKGIFALDGTKEFTLSIPYERLPEHLKTILVTLDSSEANGEQFNFLLRVNSKKTAYTARLAPLGVHGSFPFRIAVFDYKITQIGFVHGQIDSSISVLLYHEDAKGVSNSIFNMIFALFTRSGSYLVWFVLLLIALALIARRLLHAQW